MTQPNDPNVVKAGRFVLALRVDDESMIGRQWWHAGLKTADERRRNIIIGAVATGFFAMCGGPCVCAGIVGEALTPSNREERRRALALQRQHGWSFGVAHEAGSLMRMEPGVERPASLAVLDLLSADLRPTNPAHVPFYVPTLFESLTSTADPTVAKTEDRVRDVPLRDVIRPVGALNDALFTLGVQLGATLATPHEAVIVDMPGPQAVAFAAGACRRLDPVFVFDNWPHPRGVVPAHRTLAAALHYRDAFVAAAGSRPFTAPPLFVLDRARLPPGGVDEANAFDNRYLAKLPSADALRAMGVQSVTYVTDVLPETDDVNDDLVAWRAAGIKVTARVGGLPPEAGWSPVDRRTAYAAATPPAGFGEVPVIVGAGGVLLGARLWRDGSWNRSSSSSSSYGGG